MRRARQEANNDKQAQAQAQAQRHRGTEAQRHRGTEAQRHRGTEAQGHRGTEAQRHRQWMMGQHQRLASLCATGVGGPVATSVSTAATGADQPRKCGTELHNKV